jgi:hypothetical protein
MAAGRAFGMIVAAAVVLAGVGWGVHLLVERVERSCLPDAAGTGPLTPRRRRRASGRTIRRSSFEKRWPRRERTPSARSPRPNARRRAVRREALPVGGDVTRPIPIEQPAPRYTEAARRLGSRVSSSWK